MQIWVKYGDGGDISVQRMQESVGKLLENI